MDWQKIEIKWHEIARRLQSTAQVSPPKSLPKSEKPKAVLRPAPEDCNKSAKAQRADA